MSETGFVKFFSTHKGYGFLKRTNGGPDVFVHQNDIEGGAVFGPWNEGFVHGGR
jgi:cold shock CspA family protein